MNDQDLREKLAAFEHERWAKWQNYLHSFLVWNNDIEAWVLSHEKKDHWQGLTRTPFNMLSEEQKQSDRKEVDQYWPLIEKYIEAAITEAELKARINELLYLTNHADPLIMDLVWVQNRIKALTKLTNEVAGEKESGK
jgi:metal-dependent hydrolase (beta-lactamase superfamily II)